MWTGAISAGLSSSPAFAVRLGVYYDKISNGALISSGVDRIVWKTLRSASAHANTSIALSVDAVFVATNMCFIKRFKVDYFTR